MIIYVFYLIRNNNGCKQNVFYNKIMAASS